MQGPIVVPSTGGGGGGGFDTAGTGLTSTGTTVNFVANADGSLIANANDAQVGVLATDGQHGNRGGGGLHADVVAGGASGFMSGADKTKLNGIATGAIALWRAFLADFWNTNIAANTTTTLRRNNSNAADSTRRVPYACTITAIEVMVDAALTAGTSLMTIQVTINGTAKTAAGEILTLAANAQKNSVLLASPIAVAAGDDVGVRVVTDVSWTATTADPSVGLWVSGTA